MKILENKKLIIASILAVMMIFVAGILAFSGMSMTAYAQEDESIHDGYTMGDIQDLLNSNNSLGSTEFISVFNEDGSMIDLEVEIEDENSSSTLNQPMAAPAFTVQPLVNSGRSDNQSIVITIMGDGFTSTQQATFISAATNAANYLIEQYPMSLFKDYFNIYAIEVVSAQSGVSRDINQTD